MHRKRRREEAVREESELYRDREKEGKVSNSGGGGVKGG